MSVVEIILLFWTKAFWGATISILIYIELYMIIKQTISVYLSMFNSIIINKNNISLQLCKFLIYFTSVFFIHTKNFGFLKIFQISVFLKLKINSKY